MKLSVITVCRNAAATLGDTICSVAAQKHPDIEHIVIDGDSSDGTPEIVSTADSISKWISEPDCGIYDAMNKGIALATGDVVGFLNADDVFAHDDVCGTVAEAMSEEKLDACYGDIVFVSDDLQRIVRYYKSNSFSPKKLAYGWMPAHPSLFLKRRLFEAYGKFETDYEIAADYEMVARLFWKHSIRYRYLPGVSVRMRMGGVSTRGIRSNVILNREIVRACRANGINTNLVKVCLKYPWKIMELFLRPS